MPQAGTATGMPFAGCVLQYHLFVAQAFGLEGVKSDWFKNWLIFPKTCVIL